MYLLVLFNYEMYVITDTSRSDPIDRKLVPGTLRTRKTSDRHDKTIVLKLCFSENWHITLTVCKTKHSLNPNEKSLTTKCSSTELKVGLKKL